MKRRTPLRRRLPLLPLLLGLVAPGVLACHAARHSHSAASSEVTSIDASAVGAPSSINDNFRAADLDVPAFVERFEGESREVYAQREGIVAAVGLHPGDDVADVGSGTGLFTVLFAQAVGPKGAVYAVDIAPRFLDYVRDRAFRMNLPEVHTVLCTERSTELPARSVDLVFVCDTYHHFEHPADTLASIHDALRRKGRLVIIDFERIPGVSRPWVVNHVRCGKDEVRAEVEAAGFQELPTPHVPGLRENYMLVFQKD